MNNLFVKPQHLKMLTDIFNTHCPHAEIWAYGSRINGSAHDGSDLDLVIRTRTSEDANAWELKEIFTESNIPFLIDIHEFDLLPKSFQEEILKKYVVLFK